MTGHGSILFHNTASEKITYLISKMMERREIEVNKLKAWGPSSYANITTINLTMLKGGVQGNVIPPELSATFDIRLSVIEDHDQFQSDVSYWHSEKPTYAMMIYVHRLTGGLRKQEETLHKRIQ